jgi:hypothetical protein
MKNLIAKFLMLVTLLGAVATFSFAGNFDSEAELNKYRINAYQTRIHQYYLKAGTKVDVELFGDSYTNLDLYIYDGYGNLIVAKEGKTDVEIAKLTIYRSEYFTVKIVNRNNNYNDYDLKVWQF